MDEKNNFSTYLSAMQSGKYRLENDEKLKKLFIADYEQKLDLLLHLTSNLQNTIILRGKSGIGKTSMLVQLATKHVDSSDILLLSATEQHSLELIQNELIRFLNIIGQSKSYSLAYILEAYAQANHQLLLLIDDAAQLATGVISELIDYASQFSALQLVFTLTPEEYSKKNSLENIVNKCHIIDMPALNYHQSEQFIRQVIFYEKSSYALKDIDASLVEEIYRKTQGNPRKISQFIRAEKKSHFKKPTFLVVITVTVILASPFIGFYLWMGKEKGGTLPLSELSAQKPKGLILNVPELVVPKQIEPEVEVVGESPSLKKLEAVVAREEVNSEQEIPQAVASKPAKVINQDARISELVMDEVDDRQWILAQNEKKFTLQLIVLSVKENLLKEKKKYQTLGYKMFFLEKVNKKTKSYVLFFGEFQSYAEARKNMQLLPKALRKSWPRKFSVLQKDLRNSVAGTKLKGQMINE